MSLIKINKEQYMQKFSSLGMTLLVIGLVLWIVGAVIEYLAILGAVSTVLMKAGPILFWVGLGVVLIDWLISKFK